MVPTVEGDAAGSTSPGRDPGRDRQAVAAGGGQGAGRTRRVGALGAPVVPHRDAGLMRRASCRAGSRTTGRRGHGFSCARTEAVGNVPGAAGLPRAS